MNNLSDSVTEGEVKELFSEFGEFLRFKMLPPINTSSGKCWIAFDSVEKAKAAVEKFADAEY